MRIIGFKGGGGGVTKTSSIPDEWKPFITGGLQSAQQAFQGDELAHVEGFTPEQSEALRRQTAATGGYDIAANQVEASRDRLRDVSALKENAAAQAKEALAGTQSQGALSGRSGSARQQALEAQQQNNLTRQFADLDRAAEQEYRDTATAGQGIRDQGTAQLGQAGKAIQSQGQAEGDARYQALNRLFGLYGSAPFQSQQNQVKQGGK